MNRMNARDLENWSIREVKKDGAAACHKHEVRTYTLSTRDTQMTPHLSVLEKTAKNF